MPGRTPVPRLSTHPPPRWRKPVLESEPKDACTNSNIILSCMVISLPLITRSAPSRHHRGRPELSDHLSSRPSPCLRSGSRGTGRGRTVGRAACRLSRERPQGRPTSSCRPTHPRRKGPRAHRCSSFRDSANPVFRSWSLFARREAARMSPSRVALYATAAAPAPRKRRLTNPTTYSSEREIRRHSEAVGTSSADTPQRDGTCTSLIGVSKCLATARRNAIRSGSPSSCPCTAPGGRQVRQHPSESQPVPPSDGR